MTNKYDLQKLEKIKYYCKEIADSFSRYGNELQTFETDRDFSRSVSLCLMQIGEMSKHLSQEFRSATKDVMPWSEMKIMRNVLAHDYDEMLASDIWDTAQNTIPELLSLCENYLKSE